jgi:hypothetical protein
MANISMNKYKYILDRVLALIKDNPVEFNKRYWEYPVEIIARWLQREGAMIGDELADEAAILKFSLPKMKNEFLDNFDLYLTPEGAKFWRDVYEDRDLYYNIYPIVYNSDSIAEIEQKALIALRFIELNDSWDVKNSYSGDIDGYNKSALKNLMVNQALQGNQMDFFIFQDNINANKEEGGFDWDNSPQGESFWEEIEGSTERDRISMFRDKDINDFAEQDVIRESNLTTTTQINTKPAALVTEIEEGENRVEYFRDTKQDSLKEFAKDFPEAEAPLNKLLDLLSIKEEDRLKKLPNKKKKKKVEKTKPVEKKTTDDTTTNLQILDLPYPLKGKIKFQAPLSAEKREDGIIYEDISQVQYFIIEKKIEEEGYEVKDKEWFGFGFKAGAPQNRKYYEQEVLGGLMEIVVDKIVNQDYDYVFKTRIIYEDGTEEQLTYDASMFELLGSESKKEKIEKSELKPFQVVLAKDEGLDESIGKYYVLRNDDKYIAVKTKKLANMVMEDPDGFFKEYFDEGYVVDNITAEQYKKQKELGEEVDQDLDALMQEVDDADACDLSLESLACELDELDDI